MPNYTLGDGVTVKNLIGASSHRQLEELQTEYVRQRLFALELGRGPGGSLDVVHLKALHHHLFQDVFEWAGRTRDERVKLSDGSIATEPFMRKADGRPFLEGPKIAPALEQVTARLRAADFLRGLSREAFAERAADLMAELNGIHPFREGNGRTQRAFVGQLARQAGYDLDFSVVSRERMVQASIAANDLDNPAPMRRMFREIGDPERVAPLRQAIAFFEREGFAWNDRYLATTEPGRRLDLVFIGRAGANFLARTDTEILVGKTIDLPRLPPRLGERFTLETSNAEQAKDTRRRRPKPRGRGP